MSNKIFVGSLSWGTTDAGLHEAFSAFGEVVEARVIKDRETGRSRGFGFVTFATEEEAQTAMEFMNGQEIDGRTVHVSIAEERRERSNNRNFKGNRGGSRDYNNRNQDRF